MRAPLGAASSAPVVAVPSPSSTRTATYSIPPASFIALAYTAGRITTLTKPTFFPGSGSYSGTRRVTISTTTHGAKIYYTTNGTTPTTSSKVYSGPITVSSSETLKPIAGETDYKIKSQSNVRTRS
jgi:hypothetical protein